MTGDESPLDVTYREYERSGRAAGRWSSDNPGNRAIHAERDEAFAAILAQAARRRPIEHLLEIGCGEGALLDDLAEMPAVHGASCVGIDLLAFRLAAGHEHGHARPMAQADGQHLPFPAATFDVVVLSTVISSVPDDATAAHLAGEAVRVLRQGGQVLWYDMRYPNPANRNIRPVSTRRLRRLFPGLRIEVRSTTVVPQVARRLGGRTDRLYPLLARVPFARTHLVGTLEQDG